MEAKVREERRAQRQAELRDLQEMAIASGMLMTPDAINLIVQNDIATSIASGALRLPPTPTCRGEASPHAGPKKEDEDDASLGDDDPAVGAEASSLSVAVAALDEE
jgi:hypothetical protein